MRSDHEMHITSVRLDPEVFARFRTLATEEHRTVSQLLRVLIDRHIAEAGAVEAQERAA